MPTIILAHGRFLDGEAKTAEALIRYGDDPVLAVVDEKADGRRASSVVGAPGEGTPVVPTMKEALSLGPDRLAIGVAPVGGRLPEAWRNDVETALRQGVDVVSGLHDHLADDPLLAQAAEAGQARIHDVRVPPDDKPIYSSKVFDLDATVVLTVGTDCSSGKMTTAVELVQELRDRGIDTGFAATGQAGLMLDPDSGVPIDAVASDFTAGWTERIVLEAAQARDADVVVVEGQGALSHPAYAGVSLGLLHGASPHACILCHEPARAEKGARFHDDRRFPVLDPADEWALVRALASVIREPELVGLSLIGDGWAPPGSGPLSGVPAVDVLADGPKPLADRVEELA